MINIKNLNPNKIKTDKKSYKSTLIYYIGYKTINNLSYIKINSLNVLYLIIDKINGNNEENNGNIHLMLVPTDESKNTLKKYEELRSKIRDLFRSITNNSDNVDKKYIKSKLIQMIINL